MTGYKYTNDSQNVLVPKIIEMDYLKSLVSDLFFVLWYQICFTCYHLNDSRCLLIKVLQ